MTTLAIFIIDDTDFDFESGESLVYHVFISEEYDLPEPDEYKKYTSKCLSRDSAWDYAESLSKKFPSFEFVGEI